MKYEIKFISLNDGPGVEWPHFEWRVVINGVGFDYKTGLGHRTDFYKNSYNRAWDNRNKRPSGIKVQANESAQCWMHVPTIERVLECLFSDAECGAYSFNEFCDNFGYDRDSIKALDTYRACMDAGEKLRKALGAEYGTQRKLNEERQAS